MKKIIILFLIGIFVIGVETGFASFEQTYGGTNGDYGYSVQQTSDNGYIIAGFTESYGAGGADVYLIKVDSTGATQWTKTYGGTDYDWGASVQQTSDGGYIIAGDTYSSGAGGEDVYLLKVDNTGATQWTKTYGGANDDEAYSVQQTSDGGYIIAGGTSSYGAGGVDVYLLKVDNTGATQWTKTYGGANDDGGYSVEQTSDNGYIIAGYTKSYGAGGYDVYLIKVDSSGATQWTKTYGGTSGDFGNSVQQTSDDRYIIAGGTGFFGAGGDVYLLKVDNTGATQWTKTYGGTNDDAGNSVQQTSDNGYIIAGFTESYGAGGRDVYLLKVNSTGATQWTKTYGGADDDEGYSVQQTSEGGYIIAGWTETAGEADVYLIKVDNPTPNNPPVVNNVTSSGNSGDITITYDLTDGDGDLCSIYVEYKGGSVGGAWTKATVSGTTNGITPGLGKTIAWQSGIDEVGQSASDYQIRITPNDVYTNGTSGISGTFSVSNTPLPSPPVWISATVISTNQIDLKWNDLSTETSYTLFRNTANSTNGATNICGLYANQTNYSDVGLQTNTTYYYWLKAYNVSGESPYSTVISNITFSLPVLSSPTWISATAISTNQIDLQWQDLTNETSYTLFGNTANSISGSIKISGFSTNVTNYSDTSLQPDTTYYYWLRAYNTNGQSLYSTVISNPTLPSPPVWISATSVSTNEIDLKWQDLSTETSYTLFRNTANSTNGATNVCGLSANVTNYSDVGLQTNTTYYYWLKVYNVSGESPYSTVISNTSLQAKPNLLADNLDSVVAGPNPFKIGDNIPFRFERLPVNAMIKIYTIAGELARTLQNTDGDGRLDWDLKNDDGETIVQGIYICEITDDNGIRKLLKIAIVK